MIESKLNQGWVIKAEEGNRNYDEPVESQTFGSRCESDSKEEVTKGQKFEGDPEDD